MESLSLYVKGSPRLSKYKIIDKERKAVKINDEVKGKIIVLVFQNSFLEYLLYETKSQTLPKTDLLALNFVFSGSSRIQCDTNYLDFP